MRMTVRIVAGSVLTLFLFLSCEDPERELSGGDVRNTDPFEELDWRSLVGKEMGSFVSGLSFEEIRGFLEREHGSDRALAREAIHEMTVQPYYPASEIHLEVFTRYAELDFEEAWDFITDSGEPLNDNLVHAAYRGRGRAFGFPVVEELIDSLMSGDSDLLWKTEALEGAVRGWTEVAPEKASEWAWKYRGVWFDWVIHGLLKGLPDTTSWPELWEKAEGMGTVVLDYGMKSRVGDAVLFPETFAGRWILTDPEAAVEWLDEHDWLKEDAMAVWLAEDPKEAVLWFAAAEADGRLREGDLARGIEWASSARSEFILAEVMELGPGKARDLAIQALIDSYKTYYPWKDRSIVEKIASSGKVSADLRERAKAKLDQ